MTLKKVFPFPLKIRYKWRYNSISVLCKSASRNSKVWSDAISSYKKDCSLLRCFETIAEKFFDFSITLEGRITYSRIIIYTMEQVLNVHLPDHHNAIRRHSVLVCLIISGRNNWIVLLNDGRSRLKFIHINRWEAVIFQFSVTENNLKKYRCFKNTLNISTKMNIHMK